MANTKHNEAQIAAIAQVIAASASSVVGKAMAADTARKDATLASGIAYETRLDHVVGVAKAALTGAWNETEIKLACIAVQKQHGDKRQNDPVAKKTLQNFISELRVASAVRVRPHVDALAQLCGEVWDAEVQDRATDKEAPTPCKTAFKRLHNMTMAAFALCNGSTKHKIPATLLQSHDDIVMWAESRDPSLDPENIAKQIEQICAKLSGIAQSYPVQAIGNAVKLLIDVDEKALAGAQTATTTYSFGIPTPNGPIPTVGNTVEDEDEEETNEDNLSESLDSLTDITNIKQAA